MSIVLSRKVDEFVPKERWVASLSNGETVYDDIRPIEPAWKRLGDYCKVNDLHVTCLRMFVAGAEIKLPSGKDGYFQKKIAWGFSTGLSGRKLCIGYLENGLTLTHAVDSSGDSRTIRPGDKNYTGDPGEPFTIYRIDVRKKNELF